ncbi:MAG: universal stress protein [Desulfosarcinaceae bacterium]|nr:universal stress protein [Desulfosarcinaceae bacterium]
MQKKILIALDDSTHSRYALKYGLAAAKVVDDLHFVLVWAHPEISPIMMEEARTDVKVRREVERLSRKQQDAAKALLQEGQDTLMRGGVAEANIQTTALAYGRGIAQDLIGYAERQRLDAIVAGRRGISGLQAFFMGSVSNNLVQQSMEIPVWVVGGKVTPANLLVAVDGRENALRALDHVAFMLGPPKDIRLTLVHMRPRLRDYCEIDYEAASQEAEAKIVETDPLGCVDAFFPKVQEKLREFGFDPDRATFKPLDTLTTVAGGIVKEAQSGDYDTVILGRRGADSQGFTGRVSHHVLNALAEKAVWIVP